MLWFLIYALYLYGPAALLSLNQVFSTLQSLKNEVAYRKPVKIPVLHVCLFSERHYTDNRKEASYELYSVPEHYLTLYGGRQNTKQVKQTNHNKSKEHRTANLGAELWACALNDGVRMVHVDLGFLSIKK